MRVGTDGDFCFSTSAIRTISRLESGEFPDAKTLAQAMI